MTQKSLSVILLTWNSEKDVEPCIASILEATKEIQTEIIVVDNGSQDNTLQLLDSFKGSITLHPLPENKGVAPARNIGMKLSHNDVIWILDIDTIVNKEAAEGMFNYITEHDECGLCACKLTDVNGIPQESCRKLPWPKYKLMNILATRKFLPKGLGEWINEKNEQQFYHKELSMESPFSVEYTIGACQMFRREILDEIGYLDEKIFYGPEDADFCQRIARVGKEITILPQFRIIHHYNRASQKKLLSAATYKHVKGLIHYYVKQIG